MNTGILLSGYRPEFNLVLKAIVVLAVLMVQSPSVSLRQLLRRKRP
jgi:simple sugar transport system permease protein